MSTMTTTDALIRAFQSHLLADARERVPGLSARVRDAFVAVPRHMFVEESGGGDVLFLLRREQDHFRSLFARPCMFVPVTGPSGDTSQDPEPLSSLPLWQQLAQRRIRTRPLLCGSGRGDFASRTFDLRSFLSNVDPRIRYFLDNGDRDPQAPPWTGCTAFGLCLQDAMSIALARGTSIDTYGNADAGDRMEELLRLWFDLGMPSAAGLDVRAFPADRAPQPGPGEWAIKRRDTCFIWSPRPHSRAQLC